MENQINDEPGRSSTFDKKAIMSVINTFRCRRNESLSEVSIDITAENTQKILGVKNLHVCGVPSDKKSVSNINSSDFKKVVRKISKERKISFNEAYNLTAPFY